MVSDLIFDYLDCESAEEISILSMGRGIVRDSYEIVTDEESVRYGKPKGRYELLGIPEVVSLNSDDICSCTEYLSEILKSIFGNIDSNAKILVVGLGNRHISSDSLGAKVAGKINITIDTKFLPQVMAIAPSVMGLTGIETVDIVEGVIAKTRPTHVIIIDSLCASSEERLVRSIQVTNTGICPGGGIGNKRKCIDDSIAENVFSIGVPLLIFASTFVEGALTKQSITFDRVSGIMHSLKKSQQNKDFVDLCKSLERVMKDSMDNVIVSIKDIEESVEVLSTIIANAINIALGVDEY
ncbi:MAG: GPR endopeptidase [Clostridia bacterium]|nr:GPR endopeptidase [Clostridia bacterium]